MPGIMTPHYFGTGVGQDKKHKILLEKSSKVQPEGKEGEIGKGRGGEESREGEGVRNGEEEMGKGEQRRGEEKREVRRGGKSRGEEGTGEERREEVKRGENGRYTLLSEHTLGISFRHYKM